MERSADSSPSDKEDAARAGSVVVIGNFDGVHRGHQAVFAEAARIAQERALEPLVLTFDPHPAEVLGRKAPPLLTPLARKIALAERTAPGMRVVVERFDRDFASLAPRAFAERVLAEGLGARVVMVGQNFRFGAGRAGDFEALAALGADLGFETRSHPLVGDDEGRPWSSTRAREAIARGDLTEAARILGRPHALSGVVVTGDQRGRQLGFPTANILDMREALPPLGVYAVLVDKLAGEGVEGERGARVLGRGVANLGVRPTVDPTAAKPRLEVNLFDLDEDLYGARLRVHLAAWLRPEQRFSGLDALKAQIAEDARRAREAVEKLESDPRAGGAWA
ncbi:bifunctional riboflavin kinase/FAD synthetase [Polyangium aurulentum]|uniref:bifunctional riboflavin kinase/FAD synthetase n=1 Tax=Polyangium aurulentum TaxID=2567896 RepID=UPI0010AE8452|nr:bifunctional riboflavin kinase/FAD synthetase [Polyangium aurulentum]UQA59606.1 bifunctional riboflavin kinase/FAD synthetase [Polyangium aurulentum]